ncbi:MAG: hypothetical protein LWX56_05905 [Ignavibacteria bacterium]|nr:hypothetical protein [Ignavibacteria bacterium]
MSRLIVVLFIIYFFGCNFSYAQEQPNSDVVSAKISSPDSSWYEQYRANADYNYHPVAKRTWQEIVLEWIGHALGKFLQTKIGNFLIANFFYLVLLIAIALAGYIVYRKKIKWYAPTATRSDSLSMAYRESDLCSSDFDKMIEEAISNEDFRLAIRFSYVKSLRILHELHLIELGQDKTNYQYLRELKDYNVRTIFAQLTQLFEVIWYGSVNTDTSHLQVVFGEFQAFNRSLKGSGDERD